MSRTQEELEQFKFETPFPDKIAFKFPPDSVAEAEQISHQLLTDILEIEAQLSDRDRRDAFGGRIAGDEYWSWRTKAIQARAIKTSQRAKLKLWMKQASSNYQINGSEPVPCFQTKANDVGLTNLFKDLSVFLHALAADGIEFDEWEQSIVDAVDRYCE